MPKTRVVVECDSVTGKTEVQYDAGAGHYVAGVLLDVVGQISDRLVPKDPKESAEIWREIVKFQLNTANQIIAQRLKPGVAEVDRIKLVGAKL